MDEFVTKRSLYHAKTGNFTGFCVSISSDLNENKLDELYDSFLEIRGKMSNIDPETETWFTIDEFVEYQNNPQDITTMLFEVANTATRMKLRRAAKRTSKRRSRKRFIRRRIRKNQVQLKKRAYGQVKTMLRKRLSGGRPWSKISLSTRSRIDASINKRKSILVRMVKTRLPKMAGQETKRLQRVRLNSSYEPSYDNLLIESKRGPSAKSSLAQDRETKKKKTEGARDRQRKHRQKAKDSMMEFIKDVVVVKNGEKFELVERSSLTSNHTDRQDLTSIGAALSVCKKREDGNFQQTKTSKKLCGVLEDLPKTLKKTKGNNQMASSTNSNNNAGNEEFPIQPEIPYGEQPGDPKDLPKMFRDFKINEEYKPEALELGITLVSRMTRSGNSQILEDIEDIQTLLENTEDLTNDDIDMIDDIHERLMKSGLEEKDIAFLVSNKNLYTISNAQFNSGFMSKDINGNAVYRKISKFGFDGDTIQDYALIHMGRTSIGVTKEGLDGTSKSDITAVHIPTVLSFLGKQNTKLSEKEINDLMTTHVNNMNIASGGSPTVTGKKRIKEELNASNKYYNDFQEWAKTDDNIIDHQQKNPESTFGVGVFQGFSLKEGPSRIGSSNVSGDGANTISEAYKRIWESLSDEERKSDEGTEFNKTMNDLFEELKTGTISATTLTGTSDQARNNAQPSVEAVEKTKQKLSKLIESLTTGENVKKSIFRKFTDELLYISLTGDTRISPNSPGIATHLFYTSGKESLDAGVAAIDREYTEKLLKELEKGKRKTDFIINMALKSGGVTSKKEKEYAKRFDAHVADILTRLKKGETVGKLTSKSKKGDVEDEILGNIYSAYDKLDDLNGNRDELIKKLKNEGQDPKDITSELYLMENDIRDKRYSLRIVLNLINNIMSMTENSGESPNLLTQSFSFNPILSFLVEHYSVLNEDIQSEQTKESLKEELNRYIDNAKRSIGTGPDMLGNMMEFFEIDFDLYTTPINFQDVLPKSGNFNNVNSIYINDKEIKVPISEYYSNLGKLFLSEAKKKRDYTKDIEYESSPKQRHNRVKRVLARRFMEKKGLVHKGDGKDVDHKDGNPTNNSPKNLRVMSRSKNRAKH